MPPKFTKPNSTTSYKETAMGILPRSKVVQLEQMGVKKALEHIVELSEAKTSITPEICLKVH